MKISWLAPLAVAAAPYAQVVHAAQYMTIEQAQRAAFPDATEFRATPVDAAASASLAATPGWSPKAWQATAGARAIGWLLVDQVIGKSELITYAVALDTHGAVRSIEILDYRESHGGEIRDPQWRLQFAGKSARDPLQLDRDIRNISGATLSCRHVADGVKRLLDFHARVLSRN